METHGPRSPLSELERQLFPYGIPEDAEAMEVQALDALPPSSDPLRVATEAIRDLARDWPEVERKAARLHRIIHDGVDADDAGSIADAPAPPGLKMERIHARLLARYPRRECVGKRQLLRWFKDDGVPIVGRGPLYDAVAVCAALRRRGLPID